MKPLRFSKDYTKLSANIFTTIRKNSETYQIGKEYQAQTPTKGFAFEVMARRPIVRADITENMAQADADCSLYDLMEHLDEWYGDDFDNFVLLTCCKVKK